MYLARLILNPASREVQRDIRNPQDLHRTLLSVFPQVNGDPRATFGLLHRLDVNSRSGSVVVNVQSRAEVDWTALPRDYLMPVADNPLVKNVGPIYDRIPAGRVFGFRLRANPTKSLGVGNGRGGRGRRVPVLDLPAQVHWLKQQAERYGFEILTSPINPQQLLLDVVTEGAVRFSKGKSGHTVVLQSVNFSGFLRVLDCDRFRLALEEGIGRGRAYGFGLLQLGRVQARASIA